jgi:hypothetical protein
MTATRNLLADNFGDDFQFGVEISIAGSTSWQ